MTDGSPLRRKIGASRPDAPLVPSPDRVWRRAVSHGIGRGLGLALQVTGVSRTMITPDDAADLMGNGMLVILLDGPGASGLAFLDPGPLTAIIEQQTRGTLGTRALPERTPTAVDAALTADTLDRVLTAFDMMTAELGLSGTVSGYRFGTRIAQAREIGTALQDATHELWRIEIDFPQSDSRSGALQIVLPQEPIPELIDQTPMDLWGEKIEARVMGSEVVLSAELGRLTLTAEALRALEVGQALTLPQTQIGAVSLKAPGGSVLGKGRLGQSAGRKALRIEPATPAAFQSRTLEELEPEGEAVS